MNRLTFTITPPLRNQTTLPGFPSWQTEISLDVNQLLKYPIIITAMDIDGAPLVNFKRRKI